MLRRWRRFQFTKVKPRSVGMKMSLDGGFINHPIFDPRMGRVVLLLDHHHWFAIEAPDWSYEAFRPL